MAEEDDVLKEAWTAATALGAGVVGVAALGGTEITTAAGLAASGAAVGAAVAVGAGVGVGAGMLIEEATDGAISGAAADGLLALVGEEESYQAASSFDDGDYLESLGHVASGAGETISEYAEETYDTASDYASEAYDAAGDALDYINPFD